MTRTKTSMILDLDRMYAKEYSLKYLEKYLKFLESQFPFNEAQEEKYDDIVSFLDLNYWKCPICDRYFEDHHWINPHSHAQPECLDCMNII